ncbi:MAG: hypothetical protein IJ682_07010 [Lachnospiraceae bacterium]|nr:hypothetical protein [Lachnospiraceae bacterium]
MAGISGIGGYNSYNSNIYGKIASGNRIQSAKDDPAGQAIASKQEAQLRAQKMQQRNAAMQQDAINIADGARAGINDYLQDINALSVQAMNGLYSDSDRQAIQNQINQYATGIDDTVSQAKYNENSVLGGTSARSLGMQNFDVTSGEANLDAVDAAINSVNGSRAQDGAVSNGLDHSISNLGTAAVNTEASLSRITDQDIGEGVTQQKREEALNQYSMAMQRRQMDDQQSLMNRMFNA